MPSDTVNNPPHRGVTPRTHSYCGGGGEGNHEAAAGRTPHHPSQAAARTTCVSTAEVTPKSHQFWLWSLAAPMTRIPPPAAHQAVLGYSTRKFRRAGHPIQAITTGKAEGGLVKPQQP